jgi:adenylyltransferase/sulfurtransferase
MPEPPAAGTTPTCDTAGIVGPVVNVIASIEALEAIKIASGHREAVSRVLTVIEMWDNRVRQMKLDHLRENADCRCCVHGEYPWLGGERGGHTAVLCGRNAVQLSHPAGGTLSLGDLAKKLSGVGTVRRNPFLLRADIDKYLLTVFPDGRAIIGGTDDISVARTVYAKYIGS